MLLIVLFLKKKKTALEETNVLNVQSVVLTLQPNTHQILNFSYVYFLHSCFC